MEKISHQDLTLKPGCTDGGTSPTLGACRQQKNGSFKKTIGGSRKTSAESDCEGWNVNTEPQERFLIFCLLLFYVIHSSVAGELNVVHVTPWQRVVSSLHSSLAQWPRAVVILGGWRRGPLLVHRSMSQSFFCLLPSARRLIGNVA